MYKLYEAICTLDTSGHDSVIIISGHVHEEAVLDRLLQIGKECDYDLTDIPQLETRIGLINTSLDPLGVKLVVHRCGILLSKSATISDFVATRPPESFITVEYNWTKPLMVKMKCSLVQAIIRYPAIDRGIIESLFCYFEYGRETGDFLKAVLANDLTESFCRADSGNQRSMFHIVSLLYNEAPCGPEYGRGSYDAITLWLGIAREARGKKDEETDDSETENAE